MSSCLQEMFCTVRKEIYATDKHKEIEIQQAAVPICHGWNEISPTPTRWDKQFRAGVLVEGEAQHLGASQNIILHGFFPSDTHQPA